jgi:hypothetical protein
MTVSKTRVNEILFAASADDPAVRLQNLERDVDLVRISIKRILMDIRERMNELENPLVIVSPPRVPPSPRPAAPGPAGQETSHKVTEAIVAQPDPVPVKPESVEDTIPATPGCAVPPCLCRSPPERAGPSTSVPDQPSQPTSSPHREIVTPLPLPAAFELFRWTQDGVNKYGHTRFGVLIETYRVMGYIGQKTSREVRQITCLMPLCPGDEGEVGPVDFVSEIYHLKRILAPDDTSLDRDMVDALMSRRQEALSPSGAPAPEILVSREIADPYGLGKKDREWMNLRA